MANSELIKCHSVANAMYRKVREAMDHGKDVAEKVRLMRWDDFDEAVQFMENLEALSFIHSFFLLA
jgi:hypothetical protein